MAVSVDMVTALGIRPYDKNTCMLVESGAIWLKNNTKLDYDFENCDLSALPANIRLFLHKYCQIMRLRPGIASESISGLSQSFTGNIDDLIWNAAESLLGEDVVKQSASFVGAAKRWR